jgi:RNA polymerase sigma factor (sigma-70 family)
MSGLPASGGMLTAEKSFLIFIRSDSFAQKGHGHQLNPDRDSPAGRFRTTRWSAVLLSAQSQASGSKEALGELCRIYWYPIYAFVRRHGSNPEDSQDLTQGFFLHLLDHKALRLVNPLKGKFRSFLIASLQNYLADEADSSRCLKRGGNLEFVPLDTRFAEDRYRPVPLDFLTAEKVFDARWAMTLLDEAMGRLREEYGAQGKKRTFETLKPFLDPINRDAAFTYDQVANELQVGAGSVKTLIHRMRKRYAFLLREEVARTVCDPGEVDEEIHSLCEALIAAEGQLGS